MSKLDLEAVLANIGFLTRTVMQLRDENEQLRELAGVPADVPVEAWLAMRKARTNGAAAPTDHPPTESEPSAR